MMYNTPLVYIVGPTRWPPLTYYLLSDTESQRQNIVRRDTWIRTVTYGRRKILGLSVLPFSPVTSLVSLCPIFPSYFVRYFIVRINTR